MATVGLALIGTGGRGQIYADVVRQLPPGVATWVAMCDRNDEVLDEFCSRNRLGHVARVTSAAEVAQLEGVDATLVCTPDSAHREPAEAAFAAGRHCLVEKPVATRPGDARAICLAARTSGRLLHLGFVLRYDPCARRLRQLVADGAIGKPIACIAHEAVGWFHGSTYMRRWNRFRELSGDMLLHKGCHTLDIVNYIFDAFPRRVGASGGLEVFRPRRDGAANCSACHRQSDCIYYTDQGPEYRERFYNTAGPQVLPDDICVYNADKDTTDTVSLLADFDNGMRLSYTMTMVSPAGERRLVLIGTEGEIRCDMSTYRIEYTPLPDRDTEVIEVPRTEGGGHKLHDRELLLDFIERIGRGDDPEAGIRDAYMSGAVAFAALESIETGAFVDVEPL